MGKAKETGGITADQAAILIEIVGELKDEVRVLRQSIDELRTELEWSMRNSQPPVPIGRPITSFPADPALPDREWAGQVNRLTPADLPSESAAAEPQELADEDDCSEDKPRLQRDLF